ncbi:MAG: PEP-CTERM sorting domain-containing protein [Verrucomicrobia bacterium]|nr:MAG: PEP-CTERM sorting domain-containing protein [Verrucomicrobiota bacterium]
MKTIWPAITLVLGLQIAFRSTTSGQGTFTYDQQSSTEAFPGETGSIIQQSQPIGQSFTPGFSEVGFVRLRLADVGFTSLGATLFINLRSDSITGAVLSASAPVDIPNGFGLSTNGYVNFFFTNAIPVTAGLTYFFQPIVQIGDPVQLGGHNGFGYAGGMAYVLGAPITPNDFWFREGTYNVPEPSSVSLVLIGFGALIHRRKRFV